MDTLSRRITNTLGSLQYSLKNKHQKSALAHQSQSVDEPDYRDRMDWGREKGLVQGHARSASGASGASSTHSHHTTGSATVTSRSISMNSVSSEGSGESPLVEQEDIVALTHNVRTIKEALGRLRRIFHPERDKQEAIRVAAHERLGDVLRILRTILEKYPPLQSNDLLMAAGQLIQQVKAYNFEDDKSDPTEFFEAIDHLALAFSSRVSEYLMGDIDTSSTVHQAARTRSCENLLPSDPPEGKDSIKEARDADIWLPHQIDDTLMRLEHGTSTALNRAKVWSKYAKDVMTYIDKRASLELEYAKNLAKLAQSLRPVLKEESYLPFQSIYCTALDQDIDNSNATQTTCNLLQTHKFIEPLSARKSEHDRVRKQIKESWQREVKRMRDSVNNLRKSRAMYVQRHQEYEKAKESLVKAESTDAGDGSRLEKKKRYEEDALQKAIEAETIYKACVVEANDRRLNLEKTKAVVLQQVRELMLQCDQTMKAVTVAYFQLQHTASAPAPVQFQTLCESSRLYEPGFQYMEFVKRLSLSASSSIVKKSGSMEFVFEPFHPAGRIMDGKDLHKSSIDNCDDSTPFGRAATHLHPAGKPLAIEGHKEVTKSASGKVAWPHPAVAAVAGSDSDSVGSSQSAKSLEVSPSASPRNTARRIVHNSSGDELDVDPDMTGDLGRRQSQSKAAITHNFRKLKTPSRCRECDSYVYFQGMECGECGLACHKKCLESLAIQCGHKRLPRKMNTFGVDLSQHLLETSVAVPHLVCKCIREIDSRGSQIKGIYRVSGVKSRVERLCQIFENGADLVDLADVHPNVIANVLKLYLRQLPEPLLTFKLYQDFVNLAKEFPAKSGESEDVDAAVVQVLCGLVEKLPVKHRCTLATLMHHLKRVADYSEENNMPPSNLGIVFGPTLLRTSEGSASLSSLVDTVHQTRAIELLITYAKDVFGPSDAYEVDYEHTLPFKQSESDRQVRPPESPVKVVAAGGFDILSTQETCGDEMTTSSCQHSLSSSSSPWCASFPPSDDWESHSEDEDDEEFGEMRSNMEDTPIVSKSHFVRNAGTTPLDDARFGHTSGEVPTSSPSGIDHCYERIATKKVDGKSDAKCNIEPNTSTASVATQTDLSFLRNLANSATTSSNENPRDSRALEKGTGTKTNFSSTKRSLHPDTKEKIVIHVVGPHEGPVSARVDGSTGSEESAKSTLVRMQGNFAAVSTSIVERLLDEGGCDTKVKRGLVNEATSRPKDDTDSRCCDACEDELAEPVTGTRHCGRHTGLLHTHPDQDSGFEECCRPSPSTSPSHYISPYVGEPQRGYRSVTPASKLTTVADYNVNRQPPTDTVRPTLAPPWLKPARASQETIEPPKPILQRRPLTDNDGEKRFSEKLTAVLSTGETKSCHATKAGGSSRSQEESTTDRMRTSFVKTRSGDPKDASTLRPNLALTYSINKHPTQLTVTSVDDCDGDDLEPQMV